MKGKLEVEPLLTPAEAGAILGLHPRTVSRYAQAGKLPSRRTAGKHRRFRLSDVEALQESWDEAADEPRHVRYPHAGFGSACHACSRAAGEPVAWDDCATRGSSGSVSPGVAAARAGRAPASGGTR